MTADTPSPRPLSEEERALWEKASAAQKAMEAVTQPFTLTTTAHDRGMWPLLGEKEHASASAWCQLASACQPAVILSLLTALASEREAGERAKQGRRNWEAVAGYYAADVEALHGALNDTLALFWNDAKDLHPDAALNALARRPDLPLTMAFADDVRRRAATSTEPAHD